MRLFHLGTVSHLGHMAERRPHERNEMNFETKHSLDTFDRGIEIQYGISWIHWSNVLHWLYM